MSLLTCAGLSKCYGATLALDSVDLTLERGEPIALVGPNGAGKTTFLSILCGFVVPDSGTVCVLGRQPGSVDLLRVLSALPQDAQLDPRFSIERQLRLYAELRGFPGSDASSEVARVLSLVDLADAGDRRPTQLSHGMRKCVVIAQSLIGNPQLVLLDEPTAGLDPAKAKGIRDLISALKDKITFVVSSHNLDELEKLCSSVIQLEGGKLIDHSSIANKIDEYFLTINLACVDVEGAVAEIAQIPGVLAVVDRQHSGIVVQYDGATYPGFDIILLEFLAKKDWRYRQLIRGRTLEDALLT